MKRREFFKFLGACSAIPFLASLAVMCKPEQQTIQDWSMNPIAVAAGHAKRVLTKNDDLFGNQYNYLSGGGYTRDNGE